jgi:hypothetical protein
LAKHGENSGIIAFTSEDINLAKTCRLPLKEISVAPIFLAGDYLDAALMSLIAAFI